MCGIVGVIGGNNIVTDLLAGLEKLEYRGYDSAGIATVHNGEFYRVRSVGKLKNLAEKLQQIQTPGNIGIGHTRWATHGKPTEPNAHPMMTKDIVLVHNGIIENYKVLKFSLQKDGYVFESETDTEVAVQFMQRELDNGATPREAFRKLLQTVEGAYAFAAIFKSQPDMIFVAKLKSPLTVGFGSHMSIGSDVSSIADRSSEVVYLNDYEYAEISLRNAVFFDKNFKVINKEKIPVSEDMLNSGKGNYEHFMLKEIMEQPNAIRKTIIHNQINDNLLDGVSNVLILACGTSYHAGLVAKYWFEKYLKIHTDVEVASEFRYREPVISDGTLVIAITQSGETIDTLEAVEYVRKNSNSKVVAITNVKKSAISRISDETLYTEAGVEVGVASTKAFTAQLILLSRIAFLRNKFLEQQAQDLPLICETVLELSPQLLEIAKKIQDANEVIFLGRDILYPIALEGSLKLKETSYIPSEGFAAGEMKHGPIALIDDSVPVICLCPYNDIFDKMMSNLQVAHARGKNIIVFTDKKGSQFVPDDVEKIIMPEMTSEYAPIAYVIPLQLLAYYVAIARGTDVDKPRNLAKSVTVE